MAYIKILLFFCFINICTNSCSAQSSATKEILRILEDVCKLGSSPVSKQDFETALENFLTKNDIESRKVFSHRITQMRCNHGLIDSRDSEPKLNYSHLQVKNLIDHKLISVERKGKKYRDSSSTDLVNNTNHTMTKTSMATTLKATVTSSCTIINSEELSGGLEIPFKGGTIAKIGLTSSSSESFQKTIMDEVTRNIPGDTVVMKPYSKFNVINKLLTEKVVSVYSSKIELKPIPSIKTMEAPDKKNIFSILFATAKLINDSLNCIHFILSPYVEQIMKPSSYPVEIKDRTTNETVIIITGPVLAEGSKIIVIYSIEVETDEVILESETTEVPYRH